MKYIFTFIGIEFKALLLKDFGKDCLSFSASVYSIYSHHFLIFSDITNYSQDLNHIRSHYTLSQDWMMIRGQCWSWHWAASLELVDLLTDLWIGSVKCSSLCCCATHETEIKIQTKRLTLVFEISKKMCVVESLHKIIWMWCLSKTMVIFLKNVSMLSKQKPFLFTVYLVYSSYGYLRWSIQGNIKPMWFLIIFPAYFTFSVCIMLE